MKITHFWARSPHRQGVKESPTKMAYYMISSKLLKSWLRHQHDVFIFLQQDEWKSIANKQITFSKDVWTKDLVGKVNSRIYSSPF